MLPDNIRSLTLYLRQHYFTKPCFLMFRKGCLQVFTCILIDFYKNLSINIVIVALCQTEIIEAITKRSKSGKADNISAEALNNNGKLTSEILEPTCTYGFLRIFLKNGHEV